MGNGAALGARVMATGRFDSVLRLRKRTRPAAAENPNRQPSCASLFLRSWFEIIMARRRGFFGGVLFACWLALGASGDDFHLLRIAVPFLPVDIPADPLPLDDPNTDFT